MTTKADQIVSANAETMKHILTVRSLLAACSSELYRRGIEHDKSKFSPEEVETFVEYTPKLKTLNYGSEEYAQCLRDMAPALEHHYQHNDHHPEHFPNGMRDMDLFQLLELCVDWTASSLRTKDGSPTRGFDYACARFSIPEELKPVLLKTLEVLTVYCKEQNLDAAYADQHR